MKKKLAKEKECVVIIGIFTCKNFILFFYVEWVLIRILLWSYIKNKTFSNHEILMLGYKTLGHM